MIQGNLIFEGQLLVVPAGARTELMSVAHASHISIEGWLRRLRECLYWPHMTTQVKDYISKWEVCRSHRSAPPHEPLQQHNFVVRSWSKIGAECQIDSRKLLVVCDYYSNFTEVARLNTVTCFVSCYRYSPDLVYRVCLSLTTGHNLPQPSLPCS